MSFNISDYDFKLPKELIAFYPSKKGESRLLVVDRGKKDFYEKKFSDIVDIIPHDSLLVRNITKVVKARIFGKKESGGRVEILILDPFSEGKIFKALIKSRRRLMEKEKVFLDGNNFIEILKREGREYTVKIPFEDKEYFFERYGHVPLPPYIKREDRDDDSENYQTCYAKMIGSSAAPTAGLHFTEEILKSLEKRGVKIVDVILHIGLGTFEPVKVDDIRNHKMHSEYIQIDDDVVELLNCYKTKKKKIVAVGTTSLRTLETSFTGEIFLPKKGFTDIFIYPPYKIKSADILITNFHLPKSTLLMLVSAFAGRELILKSYNFAIEKKFRFFSYGDAMVII
ncbi:TPA: tRNA preQ1(34) S-adenosylmethionine ribosyltransferase-isomerase QueA [candidate division WOR-3 bacterium]|nr:tRNA preQ1(34) S-adenosylmethionine ribosyltransferase-isomerase QueA [candidate division WOR-3 bacterium]